MKSGFLRTQSAALGIAAILLMLAVLMQVALAFASDRYSWDLDHEMYFGQRLLSRELIWTQEYHDKLPFLQVLFSLPAWFESIQVWRLMSLTSCVLAALSIPYLLPRVFDFPGMSKQDRNSLFAFAGTLYITLCMMLPGGLTHLNSMAASFALIAMLLMMNLTVQGTMSNRAIFWTILIGGCFAAVAISIRPYFLVPLALTAAWGVIFPLFSGSGAVRRNLRMFLWWWGVILIYGLVLNLLPYILIGRPDAFLAGIQMLLQELHPLSFYDSFINIGSNAPRFLIGGFVLACALLVFGYRPGSRSVPFLLISIFSPIALLIFIAQNHWWSHYFQFFSGYLGLVLVFLTAWVFEGKLKFRGVISAITSLFIVVFASGLFLSSVRAFKDISDVSSLPHRDADILALVQKYRSEQGHSKLSFLYPQDMYLHWQLHEPRHGFPHAANSVHILDGWWQEVKPSTAFSTPRNQGEYCDLLIVKGPEVVIATSDYPLVSCFQKDAAPYRLDTEYPTDTAGQSLLFFKRI